VTRVPAGSWKLVVYPQSGHAGLTSTYWHGDIFDGDVFAVAARQTVSGIDVGLPRGALVSPSLANTIAANKRPSSYVCRAPGVPSLNLGPLGFGDVSCDDGRSGVSSSGVGGLETLPAGDLNIAALIVPYSPGGFVLPGVELSSSVAVHFVVGETYECVYDVSAPSTCVAGDPALNDGDGVLPMDEDRAIDRDGNGDGIRDAVQSHVTSVGGDPGSAAVTAEVNSPAQVTAASVSPFPPTAEIGSLSLTIEVDPGAAFDVTLIKPIAWTSNGVKVNGVTHPQSATTFAGNRVTVHFVDGGLGDQDQTANGRLFITLSPQHIDSIAPVVTCPATPTFIVGEFGRLTVTAQDTDSGLLRPPSPGLPSGYTTDPVQRQLFVSTGVGAVGEHSISTAFTDRAGNSTTVSCAYSVVADDGDGVPPFVEDAAPGGDGNGDGIRDAVQSNVASVRDFATSQIFTNASPSGSQLTNISVTAQNAFGISPASLLPGRAATGTMAFLTVSGFNAATVDVDIYAPTPWTGNEVANWYTFPYSITPSTFAGNKLSVHLTDGGTGDGDGSLNGSISTVAIEVVRETTPPVITCPTPPALEQSQFATISATVADAGSGVAASTITVAVDTTTVGQRLATLTAVDLAGNTATIDCDYSVVVFDDGDGVPASVEDAVSATGDGNFDGVADSRQSDVASLPEPLGSGYATIVSYTGAVTDVTASDFSTTPRPPPGAALESGLYRYTVHGTFAYPILYRSSASSANAWLTPINGSWQSIGLVSDGDSADADGPGNGTVTLLVAPARLDVTPPAITCPAATPTFLLNQPNATITVDVTDSESGVEQPVINVQVGTSAVGASTFIASATDLAGNFAFTFCSYTVGVKLDRLVSPSPSATTVVKANRPIAIIWRAVDFNGAPVTDPAHFVGVETNSTRCIRGRSHDVDPVRNRGLRYLGNGRWEYDMVAPAAKGCYTVALNLVGTPNPVGAGQTAHIRVN
jgi:hypothetical protein